LTGKNAASPHGTPGQTKIKKGDLVLFDLGVIYEGYCSDITRTVAYGDITAEQEKIYNTVLQAEETAVQAVKPGVRAMDLDKIARDIIHNAGYGDYFPHRLGHGLGISVHEYPSMTATNELQLKPGMVFTIEPGIYVPEVDRKSTRLNSSHVKISYAVFCLKKKKIKKTMEHEKK